MSDIIDFSSSLTSVEELTKKLRAAGVTADQLATALSKANGDTNEQVRHLSALYQAVSGSFDKVLGLTKQFNTQGLLSAPSLAGTVKEIEKLSAATSKQISINALADTELAKSNAILKVRTATILDEVTYSAKLERTWEAAARALYGLDKETEKSILELREQKRAKEAAIVVDEKRKSQLAAITERTTNLKTATKSLTGVTEAELAVAREREKQARNAAVLDEKRIILLENLNAEHKRLSDGIEKDVIAQKVANDALRRRITSEVELKETLADQEARLKTIENKTYDQVIANKILIKSKEDLIAAEHKLAAELEMTKKKKELFESPNGQALLAAKRELAELNRAKRAELSGSEKVVLRITPDVAQKTAAKDAENKNITIHNDLLHAEARALHAVTEEEAKLIAQTEKYNQTLADSNKVLLDNARLAHGVIGAERELAVLKNTAATKSAQLSAEAAFRNTVEYRQLRNLQDEMLRKQRIHRLNMQDTVSELNLNSQVVSSFRAGLNSVGSSMGFYSASTMLAASSTFIFTSNLKEAFAEFIKFDKSVSIAAATFELDKKSEEMQTIVKLVKTVGASSTIGLQQTAEGLITIGQAGLNAGQSLTALRPILDAATIGQISVSDATNIVVSAMHQFSLTADDTRRIVDYLAIASVKSSTNVANIGHALSYVGTVASQAGFEIQEVVAMIATMSKYGVDKSRAGTAGRQLFTNLADGTERAKAVISKYGLELTDVTGRHVKLYDILRKLAALKPAEKVSAARDLVGLHALSGVMALVDNPNIYAEQLNSIENQSKDASIRMRQQFEDNLSGDISKLKNTFSLVRETAAAEYEYLLRSYAVSVEKYLVSLNAPVAKITNGVAVPTTKGELSATSAIDKNVYESNTTIKDNSQLITSLDLLVAKINDVIDAAKTLGIIFAARIGFSALSSASNILKQDLELIVDKFEAVKSKASSTQLPLDFSGAERDINRAANSLSWWDKLVLTTTTRFPALGSGLTSMASGFKAVGASLRFMAAASGYLMAAVAAYEVISLLFSNSNLDKIAEEKNRVKELREEYEKTRRSVENYYNTKEAGAIKDRLLSEQEHLLNLVKLRNELASKKYDDPVAVSAQKAASVNYDSLILGSANAASSLIGQLDKLKTGYGKQAENVGLLETALKDYSAAQEEKLAADREVARVTDYLAREKAALESSGSARYKDSIDAISRSYDAAIERQSAAANALQALSGVLDNLATKASNAQLTVSQARVALQISESEYAAPPSNSKRISEIRSDINTILGKGAAAGIPDDKAVVPTIDIERLEKLREELKKLLSEQVGVQRDLTNLELSESRIGLPAAEKLNLAIKERATIEAEIAEIKRRNPDYKSVYSPDLDRYKELMSRLIAVKQEIVSADKAASKPIKDPLESSLKDILSQYKQIEEKINPIHALEMKYEKAKTDFERLRAHNPGLISEVELSRTLLYLKREKNVQIQQEIENAKQLYLTQNPAQKEALDLTEKYSVALGGSLDQLLKIEKVFGVQAESLSEVAKELSRIQETVDKGGMSQETGDKMKKLIIGREANKATSNTVKFRDPTFSANEATRLFDPFIEKEKYLLEKQANEFAIIQRFNSDKEKEEARHNSELLALSQQNADGRFKTQEEYQKYVEESNKAHTLTMGNLESVFKANQTARNEEYLKNEKNIQMTVYGGVAGAASQIFGQFAALGENATKAQKAAFIAQKALAIAEIILYTEVAAAKAAKDAPTVFAGIPLSAMIRAQGYASAAMVAGLAIGQISASKSSEKKGGYSGAYDNGGTIPAGSWGIVGEYAPEIVHGPAKVISRKDTAKLLNESSGSGNYSITLAPVVNVTSSGGTSEKDGILLGNTIKAAVLKTLQEQTRPNGMLDSWVKSRR